MQKSKHNRIYKPLNYTQQNYILKRWTRYPLK